MAGAPESAVWQVSVGSRRGTAWPVADGVCVTAAHVVGDDAPGAEVRTPRGTVAARVRVVEPEYDVALLDLRADPAAAPLRCAPVVHDAAAEAVGWPSDGTNRVARVRGALSLTTDGSCALHVPAGTLDGRLWQGMSGAPVASEAGIVGIVTHVHPARSLMRLCAVESFNAMLPPEAQPLRATVASDPRTGQLTRARNELLRGTSDRGLAFVAHDGFQRGRFGRALAGLLRAHPEHCLVLSSGALGAAQPSVAARLLRSLHSLIEQAGEPPVPPRDGTDTLRAQLCLEDLVVRLDAQGERRLVLHLQGLGHLADDEVVQLGNLLACVCPHPNFRILATGGRRLQELQATHFDQHSAFHEVAYPRLEGFRAHQCDRLTDGLGLTPGWIWSHTHGHPSLSLELAGLVNRGVRPGDAVGRLWQHSAYLASGRHRLLRQAPLREACALLHRASGALTGQGFDPAFDELQMLGMVSQDLDAWRWTAPLLQGWIEWLGVA